MSRPPVSYTVRITTAKAAGSGMPHMPFIVLLGASGNTERLRLKRILYGKRTDAYRRMCSTPIDAKSVFKTARRELQMVEESIKQAEEIERTPVQLTTCS